MQNKDSGPYRKQDIFSDGFALEARPYISDGKEIFAAREEITQKLRTKHVNVSWETAEYFRDHGLCTSARDTVFNLAIVNGSLLRKEGDVEEKGRWIYSKERVRQYAKEYNLKTPPQEVAYHLCRSVSYDWVIDVVGARTIIVMHEPFAGFRGLSLLGIDCMEDKIKKLRQFDGRQDPNPHTNGCFENDAFAFLI